VILANLDLSPNLAGDEAAFLDLEFQASEPYTSFVYSTTQQALDLRRFLFEKQLCEFSPPYGRLLRDAGRPVGMLALLSGSELNVQRLKAAHALSRSGLIAGDPALGARLQLAGRTLLKVLPDDLYLSRVATAPAARGKGIGSYLMRQVESDARARASRRVVLEVSPVSAAAVQLYRRSGFEQID